MDDSVGLRSRDDHARRLNALTANIVLGLLVWFILRLCQHDSGCIDEQSQIQIHSVQSSLLVTHQSTNHGRRALNFMNMPLSKPWTADNGRQYVLSLRRVCLSTWLVDHTLSMCNLDIRNFHKIDTCKCIIHSRKLVTTNRINYMVYTVSAGFWKTFHSSDAFCCVLRALIPFNYSI